MVPQDIYVGLAVLQIGTASAVINFNDGMVGILRVLVTVTKKLEYTK